MQFIFKIKKFNINTIFILNQKNYKYFFIYPKIRRNIYLKLKNL